MPDPDPDASKPFENEHSCRIEDPDDYDSFRRENDAQQVDGKAVDFIFGIVDDESSELQAIRYPLDNGWGGESGEDAARAHCEEQDSIMFEPADPGGDDEESNAAGCCGETRTHDMRTTKADDGGTVTKTVHADGVVTREVDDEDVEMLRVPISSTREDRDGDAFAKSDLEARAEQIRSEKPLVHDDHGAIGAGMFGGRYSARETIGTQMDAELEEDDDGHHTLYAYINPDGTHPEGEGERMLRQVKEEKQAIKFSVGFRVLQTADDMVEEDRPDRANEIPGRLFMRTDIMETSRVGIPANPDASASPVVAKSAEDLADVDMDGLDAPVILSPEALAHLTTGGLTVKDGTDTNPDDTMTDDSTDAEPNPDDDVPEWRAEWPPEIADHIAALADRLGADPEAVGDRLSATDGADADTDEPEPDESAESDTDADGDGDDELAELRAELESIKESIKERGDPETTDTNTTEPDYERDADTDEQGDGGDPDETDDDTAENTGHEYVFDT